MKPTGEPPIEQFTSLARGPSPTIGPRAQRTRARLIETASELFLSKGYSGTVVEDIADACGVSRATFYTYFESKNDLMMAMSEDAKREGTDAVVRLANLPPKASDVQIRGWVSHYLEYLDRHGAFVIAWYQASREDPELRREFMTAMALGSRALGKAIARLRGSNGHSESEPEVVGFILLSMLERTWYYWTVMETPVPRSELVDGLASTLRGIIKVRG